MAEIDKYFKVMVEHGASDLHLSTGCKPVLRKDGAIVANSVALAGHVLVEDHVHLGGLAAVHQFCRIGKMSIIGGCSKVTQDVLPYMLTDGNPAATRTINKIGLERNGVSEQAQTGLRTAHRILCRDGLTISNAIARIEAELPKIPEILHLLEFVRGSERGFCR